MILIYMIDLPNLQSITIGDYAFRNSSLVIRGIEIMLKGYVD